MTLGILGSLGCGGPPQWVGAPPEAHLGESFYPWRAATLGIDPAAARARDESLPDGDSVPSDDVLGPEMAGEASALWAQLCAQCHGRDGAPVVHTPKTPRDWTGMGVRMGFFFGGDKMRAAIYRRIRDGVPPGMPAWKNTLSREQIWALVRHVEGF